MKRIALKKLAAVLTAVVVSSCSTPYDTEKSFWTGNMGFSETQLGSDIWQIDFTGNTYTNRATTKKFTLKKAAKIALREGYPYFVIVEGETNRDVTGSNYGGGYNGLFGGSSYANSNTATTMTVQLLRTKTSSKRLVYEAKFLANAQ
jgi:hypothetical protein